MLVFYINHYMCTIKHNDGIFYILLNNYNYSQQHLTSTQQCIKFTKFTEATDVHEDIHNAILKLTMCTMAIKLPMMKIKGWRCTLCAMRIL